jgi:hypothetical protein
MKNLASLSRYIRRPSLEMEIFLINAMTDVMKLF